MAEKLIKIERWGLLFVGGKDTNGQPKSCFNCPHLLEKQEACEFMNPDTVIRRITVMENGKPQLYTPVCGYQIGGVPTSTDNPTYMGKDPEELGLEWAKGTGTNCDGYAGGAPCERFESTEGNDGICLAMTEDDNKVDWDDCCAAHKGPSMPWKDAQKKIKGNSSLNSEQDFLSGDSSQGNTMAKHEFSHSVVTHHGDGTKTIHHIHKKHGHVHAVPEREGDVVGAVADHDGMMDHLMDHTSEPNEGEDKDAAGKPYPVPGAKA